MLHCQPIPIHANLSANSVDECKLKLKQSSVIVNEWNVACAIREGRGGSDGKLQCTWHNWHMAAVLSKIEQMSKCELRMHGMVGCTVHLHHTHFFALHAYEYQLHCV